MSDYSYELSSEENEFNFEEFKQETIPKDKEFLKAADIWTRVETACKELSELIGKSFDDCLIILATFKWNKEVIMDKFFSHPTSPPFQFLIQYNNAGISFCKICLQNLEETKAACGHGLCNNCWVEYCSFKLSRKEEGCLISCPHEKCQYILSLSFLRNVLGKSSEKLITEKITKSFTENNKSIRWCPSPGCEYCVKINFSSSIGEIKCPCGFLFCFNCGDEFHSPCSCLQCSKWKLEFSIDSANLNWIKQNSKLCPKCRKPIEKNQGCNHISCSYTNCNYHFCWVCLGDWKEHKDNYKCNQLQLQTKEGQIKHSQSKFDREKSELERTVFYLDRFKLYNVKIKAANKLRSKYLEELEGICQQFNQNAFDVEYLGEATDSLIFFNACLKWSYVAGYFLPDKSKLDLFEHIQAGLEQNSEMLFELLEFTVPKSLENKNYESQAKELKNKILTVLDVTRKCLKSFINLMENQIYS